MKKNLIPTPRTDKNGRTVIRHMKPESPTGGRFSAPPVVMNPVDSPKVYQEAHSLSVSLAKQTLGEMLDEDLSAQSILDKASPVLTSYSATTLSRILNFPWNSHSAKDFTSNIAMKWTETTANDYMQVTVELDSLGISTLHADSWHLYPTLHPANNDGDYPAERLNQLIALVNIVEYMQYGELDLDPYWYDPITKEIESTYLPYDDLREFVINPEEPYVREDIVEVVITHNAFDVDRIKAILDTSAPAIREGIL